MATPLRSLPGGRGSRPATGVPRLQTVLLLLGAVLAVNLIIAAAYLGGRGDENRRLPTAVESVTPAPDAVIRPQEDVGADLVDDLAGALQIDGVDIPEDQVNVVPGLAKYVFRPGEGKEFDRFRPGPHSATVFYWPAEKDRLTADREELIRSFTWRFTTG